MSASAGIRMISLALLLIGTSFAMIYTIFVGTDLLRPHLPSGIGGFAIMLTLIGACVAGRQALQVGLIDLFLTEEEIKWLRG